MWKRAGCTDVMIFLGNVETTFVWPEIMCAFRQDAHALPRFTVISIHKQRMLIIIFLSTAAAKLIASIIVLSET